MRRLDSDLLWGNALFQTQGRNTCQHERGRKCSTRPERAVSLVGRYLQEAQLSALLTVLV